ncbi:tryptophan 7-halogenase [Sphingomonas sp.]|uniref:tryptophan 7-halogenase n=1 Tax=Sphingomonas sp. TaxID=28214 RepID=UPI002D7E2D03|nr:tryptophan 7-halogenase [Sphingomonas sp.]
MRHILVCGSGLAAQMAVAALSHQLPDEVRITLLETGDTGDSDLFYGTVTGPSAYAFNLAAGVEEPALVLSSDTAFSWGTRYAAWGQDHAWTQCFALPLPVLDGVMFHQYLAAAGETAIEPYLIAATAAARGAFAHPPREPGGAKPHPLSRADYGYQFDPAAYARLFAAARMAGRVTAVTGELAGVDLRHEGIAAVRLIDGRTLDADLYVDCTGPQASLLSSLSPDWVGDRRIAITVSDGDAATPDRPFRSVHATAHGWDSVTSLKGRTRHVGVCDPVDAADAATVTLGRRHHAWAGNCVGVGHAAGILEPITPAPVMLLERDIDRLLSLIPPSGDMAVERREYNRRHDDDHAHAALFNRALFATTGLPDAPYWQAARREPLPEKLARKLALFASRGVLVGYDLEPFHPEDWVVLHLGLGRQPQRHDRLADRASPARVNQYLSAMKREIEQTVATMPESGRYRAQLERYLQRARR